MLLSNTLGLTLAVLKANLRWVSVSASMRSLSPSTWVRSRRPPSKARRVNSPRSAGRQNGKNEIALSTEEMIARPECTCSSSTFCVVNDLGPTVNAYSSEYMAQTRAMLYTPLKNTARPSSNTSPDRGCTTSHRCIFHGSGSCSRTLPFPSARVRTIPLHTSSAPGPEMRTTATPAFPGGVESA